MTASSRNASTFFCSRDIHIILLMRVFPMHRIMRMIFLQSPKYVFYELWNLVWFRVISTKLGRLFVSWYVNGCVLDDSPISILNGGKNIIEIMYYKYNIIFSRQQNYLFCKLQVDSILAVIDNRDSQHYVSVITTLFNVNTLERPASRL